jgi:hypothetical protein
MSHVRQVVEKIAVGEHLCRGNPEDGIPSCMAGTVAQHHRERVEVNGQSSLISQIRGQKNGVGVGGPRGGPGGGKDGQDES